MSLAKARWLQRLVIATALLLTAAGAGAAYCGTATNQAHVQAGRAEQYDYVYARAKGSSQTLGMYYSDSATLRETAPGYFEKVSACPPPEAKPYEGASIREVPTLLNISGRYGVAMGGGHFLQAGGGDPAGFPREQIVISGDTLNIPAGASIRHAFLYYGGVMGLAGGDFTADRLGSFEDVRRNGIRFRVNGTQYGPYNPTDALPPNQSAAGSEARMADDVFHAEFGTLTGTATTFWSNRLDITGVLKGASGELTLEVDPPENLDVNVNDASRNGGNPAGSTLYNSCLNAANWGVLVIYEHPEAPLTQLILKDDIVRAWDYIWFHKGVWLRPQVVFDNHSPMREGAKVYLMGQTGNPAGTATPTSPACTCGCGGTWNLKHVGASRPTTKSGEFWSYSLTDPEPTWNDPLHRDRSNGNWDLETQQGTGGRALRGNDWTLLQSGSRYTEFPNLFEGKDTPADSIQPVTDENTPNAAGDRYAGHPWAGRGQVRYHGVGNDLSMIEVTPDATALELGSTRSALFFKGDQKDVFKPQERVTVRFMMLAIPLEGGSVNAAPVISLLGADPLLIDQGQAFVDPGATASDAEDGDISDRLVAECSVDTSTVGDYRCSYRVTDSDGGSAEASRTVRVVGEAANTAPTLVLLGANPLELQAGSTFTDPGATASDAEDGDLTAAVSRRCDVNVQAAGEYRCSYRVTDSGGLSAQASRTVVVKPKPAGCTAYTATPQTHKAEGRAYSTGLWLVRYYATGSDEPISGYWWSSVTLHRLADEAGVYHVGACP